MKAPTDARRAKQVREAEELLFAGPQKLGLAKGLFLGRFVADWVLPYPRIAPEHVSAVEQAVTDVRRSWMSTSTPLRLTGGRHPA